MIANTLGNSTNRHRVDFKHCISSGALQEIITLWRDLNTFDFQALHINLLTASNRILKITLQVSCKSLTCYPLMYLPVNIITL